jgi:hypothetical protein
MTIFPITQIPRTIPSCILWLDAMDNSTITQSSNLVSAWRDKSGRGNNAIQGTSTNQPSINLNTINGLPAIAFNGSSSSMTGNLTGFSGQPYSIFTAGQRRSSAAFNYLFSSPTVAVNLGWRTTNELYHQIYTGAINTITALTVPAYTTPIPSIIAGTQSTNTRTLYFNSTTVSATSSLANDNTGATQFSLGFFNVYMNIDLGEVLVFNRVLSASEVTAITRYLSNKWGVEIS